MIGSSSLVGNRYGSLRKVDTHNRSISPSITPAWAALTTPSYPAVSATASRWLSPSHKRIASGTPLVRAPKQALHEECDGGRCVPPMANLDRRFVFPGPASEVPYVPSLAVASTPPQQVRAGIAAAAQQASALLRSIDCDQKGRQSTNSYQWNNGDIMFDGIKFSSTVNHMNRCTTHKCSGQEKPSIHLVSPKAQATYRLRSADRTAEAFGNAGRSHIKHPDLIPGEKKIDSAVASTGVSLQETDTGLSTPRMISRVLFDASPSSPTRKRHLKVAEIMALERHQRASKCDDDPVAPTVKASLETSPHSATSSSPARRLPLRSAWGESPASRAHVRQPSPLPPTTQRSNCRPSALAHETSPESTTVQPTAVRIRKINRPSESWERGIIGDHNTTHLSHDRKHVGASNGLPLKAEYADTFAAGPASTHVASNTIGQARPTNVESSAVLHTCEYFASSKHASASGTAFQSSESVRMSSGAVKKFACVESTADTDDTVAATCHRLESHAASSQSLQVHATEASCESGRATVPDDASVIAGSATIKDDGEIHILPKEEQFEHKNLTMKSQQMDSAEANDPEEVAQVSCSDNVPFATVPSPAAPPLMATVRYRCPVCSELLDSFNHAIAHCPSACIDSRTTASASSDGVIESASGSVIGTADTIASPRIDRASSEASSEFAGSNTENTSSESPSVPCVVYTPSKANTAETSTEQISSESPSGHGVVYTPCMVGTEAPASKLTSDSFVASPQFSMPGTDSLVQNEPVAYDDRGIPVIVRQVVGDGGKVRHVVQNEDGTVRAFGESTVTSLAESAECDAKHWIDGLTDREMRGLVAEIGQRLVSSSQVYECHRAALKQLSNAGNYAFFGLDASAGDKELDNAYRRLAKNMHPDKNGGTEKAKTCFQDMKERYEALKAERSRNLQEVDKNKDSNFCKETEATDERDNSAAPQRREAYDEDGDSDAHRARARADEETSRTIEYDPNDRQSLHSTVWKMMTQFKSMRRGLEDLTQQLKRARS